MDLRNVVGNPNTKETLAPTPQKQVPNQFGRLHSVIERLEVLVPTLEEVLAPILNVETQKETGQQGRAPFTTPLGEDLARSSDRIDNVVHALRQIIERVEL